MESNTSRNIAHRSFRFMSTKTNTDSSPASPLTPSATSATPTLSSSTISLESVYPFEKWLFLQNDPSLEDEYVYQLLELGATWDSFRGEDDAGIIRDLTDHSDIPFLTVKSIVQLVRDAIERSQAPLAVFWDMENVGIPTKWSGGAIARRLREVLVPHGTLRQFRAYAHLGGGGSSDPDGNQFETKSKHRRPSSVSNAKRLELQQAGCHLIDCPQVPKHKEVVDKMIIVDAMQFAYSHFETNATICLISEIRITRTCFQLCDSNDRIGRPCWSTSRLTRTACFVPTLM